MEPKPSGEQKSQYPFNALEGDNLKDFSLLLDGFHELISRLPVVRHADTYTHEMSFFLRGPNEYDYPKALEDRLITRELREVRITITQQSEDDFTSSIEFEDDDGILYVSRTPGYDAAKEAAETEEIKNSPYWYLAEEGSGEFDYVIENQVERITHNGVPRSVSSPQPLRVDRIPDDQITAFLESISKKDTDAPTIPDDISELIDTPKIKLRKEATDFADKLSGNAISNKLTYTFGFGDDPRSVGYTIEKAGSLDRLVSVIFYYETAPNNPRKMSVKIDRTMGFSLEFATLGAGNPEGGVTPHIPDGGDYIRLIEVIAEENNRIKQLEQDSFDAPNA